MYSGSRMQQQQPGPDPFRISAAQAILLPTTPVAPRKRSDEDIQFVSSRPVKKRRVDIGAECSAGKSCHPRQPPPAPVSSKNLSPRVPGSTWRPEPAERRISTGMVVSSSNPPGMASDVEPRGVSLPELEKFTWNCPPRQQPIGSPPLSPKSLPQTISPALLLTQPVQSGGELLAPPGVVDQAPQNSPGAGKLGKIVHTTPSNHQRNQPDAHATHNTYPNEPHWESAMARDVHYSTHTPVATAPCLAPIRADSPLLAEPAATVEGHPTRNHNASKIECIICAQTRQQATLARAQGLSVMNAPVNPSTIPQVPSHQPPSQNSQHPALMAMGMTSCPGYNYAFAPMMIPANGRNFGTNVQHATGNAHPQPVKPLISGVTRSSQPVPSPPSPAGKNSGHTEAPRPTSTRNPPTKQPSAASSSIPPSPLRPPATLIQPTYRKPSPNLIVDVAETCQEKFPFEEVARRHGVPIDKVFDIFAAIIKAPLLRCPTDRRRAGKLATSRIKEYNKARRDIMETRGQPGSGGVGAGRYSSKEGFGTGPSPDEIAARMGPLDVREGVQF